MREETTVEVSAGDRARLEAVVADRNSPQKHVWRARIVLAAAEGRGTVEITRRVGVSKQCVRRWRARFAAEGVAGLLRDRTRPPGCRFAPPFPHRRGVSLAAGLPRHHPHRSGASGRRASGATTGAAEAPWR